MFFIQMSARTIMTITSALLIGSAATLIPSAFLSSPCYSCGNRSNTINAPIFAGLVVFMASSLGLLIEYATTHSGRYCFERRNRYFKIFIPGLLNSIGTLLQLGALIFIPAAVLAGLRGVFIAGTAVASSYLRLRDAPVGFKEWAAVISAALGAIAVGAASALAAQYFPSSASSSEGSTTASFNSISILFGLLLSVAGYLIATGQVIFEQLSLDVEAFSRWEILGIEGIVGTAITSVILLALSFFQTNDKVDQFIEYPPQTICCLTKSISPSLLLIAYGASSLTFNALLLIVASTNGPNARVFVFVVRGVLTWVIEIILSYAGSPGGVGRGSVLTPLAALEAFGWVLLIVGGIMRSMLQNAREAKQADEVIETDEKEASLLLSK